MWLKALLISIKLKRKNNKMPMPFPNFKLKNKEILNWKMPNKELVKFIRESRKRGFDDFEIREPLLKKGWPLEEIEKAFYILKPKYKLKNKISVYLDSEILKMIDKRAKKNMLTLNEQIEDILRRSCVNMKKGSPKAIKCDDNLVAIFSREKRGKKGKKSNWRTTKTSSTPTAEARFLNN